MYQEREGAETAVAVLLSIIVMVAGTLLVGKYENSRKVVANAQTVAEKDFNAAQPGDLVYFPGGISGREYWRMNSRTIFNTLALSTIRIPGQEISLGDFEKKHAHLISKHSGMLYETASAIFVRDEEVAKK